METFNSYPLNILFNELQIIVTPGIIRKLGMVDENRLSVYLPLPRVLFCEKCKMICNYDHIDKLKI